MALRQGELDLGRLVLPANSFDLGDENPTAEERAAGRAAVEAKCAGKDHCVLGAEPSFKVTRGAVNLQLTVEIDRP